MLEMSIYTRTGDQGMTSLRDGLRIPKNHLQIEVLGGMDEINSSLGLSCAMLDTWMEIYKNDNKYLFDNLSIVKEFILSIQSDLLYLGSEIASYKKDVLANSFPKEKEAVARSIQHDLINYDKINKKWFSRIGEFERMIDLWDKELPELRNFIYPGGSVIGANLHLSRSIIRRVERDLVKLLQSDNNDLLKKNLLVNEIGQGWLAYMNRLGDLCFVCARYVNYLIGDEEKIWQV